MIPVFLSVLLVLASGSSLPREGPDDANCLPGTWLPEGSDVTMCNEPGHPYDGSLIPDCQAFHGQVNTTSFFHIHEYDCGLFWTCSPEGPCLMQCAACNLNPSTCPDGKLQFDCRYTVPVGPVCDFANEVGCRNCEETCEALNCPGEQTCDPSTDCQCSDCKTDADCSGGEECCDRVCSADCGGTTTAAPTTTTTPAPTTTTEPCPNECCADEDCPPGYICQDGSCVQACSSDSDCEGWDAICNHPAYDNCQYCDGEICQGGCAADSNCPHDIPQCTGIHNCGTLGYPGLVKIVVQTADCAGCDSAAEGGLMVHLDDDSASTEPCTTSGLDNAGKVDYGKGASAEFLATEENGMDQCKYANVNFRITNGAATWTGEGSWTGASEKPLCFYFFDNEAPFYRIFNCCDLSESTLGQEASTELTNCRQCIDYDSC